MITQSALRKNRTIFCKRARENLGAYSTLGQKKTIPERYKTLLNVIKLLVNKFLFGNYIFLKKVTTVSITYWFWSVAGSLYAQVVSCVSSLVCLLHWFLLLSVFLDDECVMDSLSVVTATQGYKLEACRKLSGFSAVQTALSLKYCNFVSYQFVSAVC